MLSRITLPAAVVIVIGMAAGAAPAADLPVKTQPMAFTPAPRATPGIVSELRFGATAHDPFSPESGSVDLNGEILFSKFFRADDPVWDIFIPRLHLGGSVNTAGKTSYAYAGLTWTYNVTSRFFVEASFGGAVHNGDTNDITRQHRNMLGCSPLFRESAAVGYRFDEHWSVMATIDHLSNAGICDQNRGLTNVGGKISYSF